MNRYFVITFSFLPVLVIAGVIILMVTRPSDSAPSDAAGLQKDLELYAEIRRSLLDHYDGELDESKLRDAALKAMAESTGDRYTRVLAPVETKAQDLDLKGEFAGIGVSISDNGDGSLRITRLEPYSGADKAGVRVDDVIVGVDGVSVLGQPVQATKLRIKADGEGTVVKLTVLRGGNPASGIDPKGERLDIDVVRMRIESWSVHDVHVQNRHGRRFGYLHISEFAENTCEPQFKNAVSQLTDDGAEGIVIDLRHNGGGRVSSAADLVDTLLNEEDALIAFTQSARERNRERDTSIRTRDDTAITQLPIVVLVDDQTASAAELVTAALKDHGRAFVIGTRSHGKGLVQTVFRMRTDPNYTVNITTTQYFTPLGRRVHVGQDGEPGGIQPDLLIEYKPGEKTAIHARLAARMARYDRENVRKQSKYWDYEDRMLSAALDVLAGVPAVIGQ